MKGGERLQYVISRKTIIIPILWFILVNSVTDNEKDFKQGCVMVVLGRETIKCSEMYST
jgi:ACR3 family arsenite efflux pump ArsB